MQQSPAGSTLPIAPGSNRVVWGHEMWLEISEGTDACMVNRTEGLWFLRTPLYVLQDYLRSPKTNKQLPQHHQQTLVAFLHTMYFSTAIPNGGLLSLPYTHQPRSWSPCAQSLWSLQAAQQHEDEGCYLTFPYPTNLPGAGLIMCLVWRHAKRDRERGDSYKCFATWMWH